MAKCVGINGLFLRKFVNKSQGEVLARTARRGDPHKLDHLNLSYLLYLHIKQGSRERMFRVSLAEIHVRAYTRQRRTCCSCPQYSQYTDKLRMVL
mgnify:CR=1 FL=1